MVEFIPMSCESSPIITTGELWRIEHQAFELGASDLHLRSGLAPRIRRDGEIFLHPTAFSIPTSFSDLFLDYMREQEQEVFRRDGQADFMVRLSQKLSLRINLFRHHGGEGAACRLLRSSVPSLSELGLPSMLARIAHAERGLILVTGVTGSGKSSTLAAMIDQLNETTAGHILTIEDPVEFVHSPKRCAITHRQVGRDVTTYPAALRAALREDPDVLLVGELRDIETMALALTAAETGHLVLATLHTRGAVSAVNRMIDVFPPGQQHQARTMLAESLTAVISQELLRKKEGGRVPCVELLIGTAAVRALIRDGKTHHIENVMQTSASAGMCTRSTAFHRLTMDHQLLDIEL